MENNNENQDQNNQSSTKPNVYIFGEEVGRSRGVQDRRQERREARNYYRWERRMHRHSFGGEIIGLLAIFAGAVLLLNYSGLVSWQFWQFTQPLWPILLILIGLKIILGRNWLSFLIMFIVVIIIFGGIVIYGLIKTNSPALKYLPPEITNFINNNFNK